MHRYSWSLVIALLASPALAQTDADWAACKSMGNDTLRLACYDRVSGRTPEQVDAAAKPETETVRRGPLAQGQVSAAQRRMSIIQLQSNSETMSQRWELDNTPTDKQGTFVFRPYKPIFILPVFHTSHVNDAPNSPSYPASDSLPYEQLEVKYQLSFKSKLWQNMLPDNGDLWFGYTQSSNWQLYNNTLSAPFRNTDYEPELFASFRTDIGLGDMRWRMFNLGVAHQSNGRSAPMSRSWNRVYAQFGLEQGNFSLLIKPWFRIHEQAGKDDNPDISDYMGRGEVLGIYRHEGHVLSLALRHSLRGGSRSHGAATLDWAFPIAGNLRGHVQAFSGYGQSLIDYNRRMNAIGLGVSLTEWQ